MELLDLEYAAGLVQKLTDEEKASLFSGRDYWSTVGVERLGIPSVVMSDGPHGLRKTKGKDHLGQSISEPATCFPAACSMGSTWDVSLMEAIGEALGEECQSAGVDILLGPGVNMKRSPLGGRNFEYYSEDPVLAGKLGAALVRGIQSRGVGACVKHYCCNNNERRRMTVSAELDESTLREIYLRAFEIIVREARPAAIMAAYNRINGVYATENERLLKDILRGEWGFDGIVLSDWIAVDDIVRSVRTGLNLEMPCNAASAPEVLAAMQNGSLSKDSVDENLTWMVAAALCLAKNRRPETDRALEAHGLVALRAAREGAVLLRNDRNILPLGAEDEDKNVAIIGLFAKEFRTQGGGSSHVAAGGEAGPLEHLEHLAPGTAFPYAQGYAADGSTTQELLAEAAHLAASCDRAVVFAGLPESYESEGYDRAHIYLPEGHDRLVEAVLRAQPNTAVVLCNGSAVSADWMDHVPCILEAWLGGQGGSKAIAELLLGLESPSGKLPETFPRRIEDTPSYLNFPGEEGTVFYGERMFIGYRWYDARKIEPRFPFGHGLSYTTFQYSDLKLDKPSMEDTGELRVSFTVTNTGSMRGREVAQLYVRDCQKGATRPEQELKAFASVELEPGASKTVTLTLNKRDFAYYDAQYALWHVQSGRFELLVGASSRDIRLSSAVEVRSTDLLAPNLNEHSTLEEWLEHPQGRLMAEDMLTRYTGFGMGAKRFEELLPFVQTIMKEMPMLRLASVSNGSFTPAEYREMLNTAKC